MRVVAALFAVAAVAGVVSSGAPAQTLECGAEVTGDVTLEASLTGCTTGLVVGADGVTIDLNGYAIKGVGAEAGSGIEVDGRSGITIRNGSIRGFATGVDFRGTSDSTVEDMRVTDSSVGIHVWFSLNIRVVDNSLSDNSGPGIRCLGDGGHHIENNHSARNGIGVYLFHCLGSTVVNNVASRNESHGMLLDESAGRVEGNTANGNGASGIDSFNNHGMFINNVTSGNAGSGLSIQDVFPDHGPFHSVTSHVANANGGYGIVALGGWEDAVSVLVGVIDGGNNRAHRERSSRPSASVSSASDGLTPDGALPIQPTSTHSTRCSRIESRPLPPLVLVEEHRAELGEPVRWVFELAKDDRPLVDRQREQLHLVAQGTLEPVGQHVGAGCRDEVGELGDGVVGDGETGEHHRARLRAVVWTGDIRGWHRGRHRTRKPGIGDTRDPRNHAVSAQP